MPSCSTAWSPRRRTRRISRSWASTCPTTPTGSCTGSTTMPSAWSCAAPSRASSARRETATARSRPRTRSGSSTSCLRARRSTSRWARSSRRFAAPTRCRTDGTRARKLSLSGDKEAAFGHPGNTEIIDEAVLFPSDSPSMNRLTAIGLASLAAYGLLLASKYTGLVSAAREERAPAASVAAVEGDASRVHAVASEPRHPVLSTLPAPLPRAQPIKTSPVALEFRNTRDLRAFADALASRSGALNADERYHLAKALEECQFATSINEDLAAYSAKQKRQFLAGLPAGDPLNQ